jgi:hypothetical protein
VFKPTTDYGRALNVQGHISFYADTLDDVRPPSLPRVVPLALMGI